MTRAHTSFQVTLAADRKRPAVVLLVDADGRHVMTRAARQSLDRVIEGLRATRLQLFGADGLGAFEKKRAAL